MNNPQWPSTCLNCKITGFFPPRPDGFTHSQNPKFYETDVENVNGSQAYFEPSIVYLFKFVTHETFAIQFSFATLPGIWLQLTSSMWQRCETAHRLQCISKF